MRVSIFADHLMKFQHLPIGARFIYEGRSYTKMSPLVASVEGGGQRVIPRYASLSPIEGAVVSSLPVAVAELIDMAQVNRALDALVLSLHNSGVDTAIVQQALAQCREIIVYG